MRPQVEAWLFRLFSGGVLLHASSAACAVACRPAPNAAHAHFVPPNTPARADPFDPDSPIKKMGIQKFPPDMFFVLRVVQASTGAACRGVRCAAAKWLPRSGCKSLPVRAARG